MEKMTTKRKLKNFWERNKGKIVAAGAITTGVLATVIMSALNDKTEGSEENNTKLLEENNTNTFDTGRDCLMTFTVEETGEVLGTIPVAESFVEDWKDLIPEINEHDYNK